MRAGHGKNLRSGHVKHKCRNISEKQFNTAVEFQGVAVRRFSHIRKGARANSPVRDLSTIKKMTADLRIINKTYLSYRTLKRSYGVENV